MWVPFNQDEEKKIGRQRNISDENCGIYQSRGDSVFLLVLLQKNNRSEILGEPFLKMKRCQREIMFPALVRPITPKKAVVFDREIISGVDLRRILSYSFCLYPARTGENTEEWKSDE